MSAAATRRHDCQSETRCSLPRLRTDGTCFLPPVTRWVASVCYRRRLIFGSGTVGRADGEPLLVKLFAGTGVRSEAVLSTGPELGLKQIGGSIG